MLVFDAGKTFFLFDAKKYEIGGNVVPEPDHHPADGLVMQKF